MDPMRFIGLDRSSRQSEICLGVCVVQPRICTTPLGVCMCVWCVVLLFGEPRVSCSTVAAQCSLSVHSASLLANLGRESPLALYLLSDCLELMCTHEETANTS